MLVAYGKNSLNDILLGRATFTQRAFRVDVFTLCLLVISLGAATTADADLTAFVGTNATPSSRQVRGFGVGLSLLMFGVEFEYSDTAPKDTVDLPSLRTGMFNLLAQAPFVISRLQFYGTIGGGLYREASRTVKTTHRATNAGGGVKIALSGPIRLRIDYRIVTLRGARQNRRQQRFYTGLNLAF